MGAATANCSETWEILFEVDADGSVLNGSRADVLSAAIRGDDMRIHLPPDVYLEVDDIMIKDGVVCAASLFVLSKSSWGTFVSNMYWKFVKVCDHGLVHFGKVYLGKSENPSSTLPIGKHSIWFTRPLMQTDSQVNPVYCNHANGSSTCGSLYDLFKAAEEGAGIRMLENRSGTSNYIYSADRIELTDDSCGIASQTVWRVGSLLGLSDFSQWYTSPFYWFVVLKSSFGSKEVSRPSIGAGTILTQSFANTCDNNWFADYCWTHSFSHGKNGDETLGSKQELLDMINQGRRVRIVFDSYAMNADNIAINNGIVTAQLLSQVVSSTETQQNVGNVISKLVRISTNGDIFTDLYHRGTSLKAGYDKSTTAAQWFVDTRQWRLVLGTGTSGSAIEGSKLDLAKAVRAGSRLRCIVKLSATERLIVTADNIEVSTDGNVAAQVFRLMEFDDNDTNFIPFWRILILTTNGEMKETRWTIGEHQHRGDNVANHPMDWYVD
ncbi:uncharacterized protein LOC117336610 [Pecten maximus]|uniref:uncharacterized protein LOC117336610 n=1 Tax=Pecten maximus TaxID=6579 RepID=UPI001458933F|nr:uncharacterized protein LOC117336610 [Pecten maximus]